MRPIHRRDDFAGRLYRSDHLRLPAPQVSNGLEQGGIAPFQAFRDRN